MAAGKRKTRPAATKQRAAAAYDSDGDSDASDGPPAPVPLQSLEQAGVRDFVAEFQAEQTQRQLNRKATSKRARAELAQLESDRQKSQFRAVRAEKVVWRKFDRDNKAFEQYYRSQLQLGDDEWLAFTAALRTPLAVHVRVNGNYASLSEIVAGTLQLDFQLDGVHVKRALSVDGDEDEGPVSLAPVRWDARTWKLSLDAKSLRKAEKLKELSSYLHTQQQLGTLQRIDPSSAILPLFLQPAAGHRVLDLCGGGEIRAPGILELMGKSGTGAVVVNEPDASAAARAAQTLGRTLALSTETLVTSHKPLEFPSPVDAAGGGGVFDRVLCSAPCSGDGLIRKIPERWRTWTPVGALQSHAAQVALAARAMALVKVGGMLLYCTRSLNPIENEAVVAELLRSADGAYELVGVDGVATNLKRLNGLASWDVVDEQMEKVGVWELASQQQKKLLRASMWPPTEEEADAWALRRCVRVLPHANDTNGLFLALIKKTREPQLASVPLAPTALDPEKPTPNKKQPPKKNAKNPEIRKVLGSYSPLDPARVDHIVQLYGVPPAALGAVLERSGFAKDASIHCLSAAAAALIGTAFHGRLHVHRAGVDAFRKATSELTDDGARWLLPSLRRRVLSLPLDEFSSLLGSKEMWLKHASESAREALAGVSSEGSIAVVLDDLEPAQTADRDLVVVASKRQSSYSLSSSAATVARVRTLLQELDQEEEDGYDSMELED